MAGGLPFRHADEEILGAERSGPRRRTAVAACPAATATPEGSVAILLQNSRLHVIGQIGGKNLVHHPFPQQLIAQRKQDFHALVRLRGIQSALPR